MEININLEKDITTIVFGVGFNLESNTLGVQIIYWQLTFNFRRKK